MTDEYRPAPKPPLSNPMAEAMAENAQEAARVAAEAAPAPTVAPEPVETPAPAPVEAAAGDPPPAPNDDATKPPKGNEKAFLARIARLADEKKSLNEQAAELRRQNAAMQELLASQGRGSEVPTTHAPQAPTTYTQADVDARAREIADWNNYNRQANDLVGIGREKFGTWDESIDNLNGAGILSEPMLQRQIVEAALATGAAPDVINHLGQNLDEALRISQLPPARMGVELATLAGKLVKKAPAISSAPAPIGNATVHGSTQAPVDFAKLAAGDDMAAYVEARKKAGDPWANARSRR